MEHFAERFLAAKGRAKLTLKEIGDALGVSAQAVKKYGDGDAMPNSASLLKLCRIFDCSVEWLMDPTPLDFHSTETAPQGKHAKYWVREAIGDLREIGYLREREE